MKRVALFLKEKQIRKLKVLARKQDLPWAFVARQAIDYYFRALEEEDEELTKEPEPMDKLPDEPEARPQAPREITAEMLRALRHRR